MFALTMISLGHALKRTKQLSIIEGSCTSVMTGCGEQYVVPFAIKLGASASQVSLLASFPVFIASWFQLLGARLTDQFQNRKRLVILFVLLQALMYAPLFILPLLTHNIYLLILCYSLVLIFGNLTSPSWNSWMGDLIPPSERSSYFAKRNTSVFITLFSSVMAAGLILTLVGNVWHGFAVLFTLALVSRSLSFATFLFHYEPKYTSDIWNDLSFVDFVKTIKNTAFGNFVIFRSSIAFAVMVSSPMYAVFMLKDLGFSYLQYSAVILTPMLFKAITTKYWGQLSQLFGNRNLMHLASVLIAVNPIQWFIVGTFFSSHVALYGILITEMFSGFAWAGFELSTYNYMLESSNSKKRARLFAYFNAILGCFVLLGALFGGLLLHIIGHITVIFLISAILRLVVAYGLIPRVKNISNHRKVGDGRLFYEVLINRPMGFAVATIDKLSFVDHKRR